jgi:hypothetical protein
VILLVSIINSVNCQSGANCHFYKADIPYVKLFDNDHHGGDSCAKNIGLECSNLPGFFNDRTTSIDTAGNCVILYEHGNCIGNSITVHGLSDCHHNLGFCGLNFNDKTSSFKEC